MLRMVVAFSMPMFIRFGFGPKLLVPFSVMTAASLFVVRTRFGIGKGFCVIKCNALKLGSNTGVMIVSMKFR